MTPERTEALLFAAQAVVNDAEPRTLPNEEGAKEKVVVVDAEVFADLTAAVRAIHDDACAAIDALRLERRAPPASTFPAGHGFAAEALHGLYSAEGQRAQGR